MNRAEILAEYEVVDGIIVSPGRFEREAIYAPAVESWSLDGLGESMYAECPDHDDCDCDLTWEGDLFEVDEFDRTLWPEIPSRVAFITYFKSDRGFIYIGVHEDDPRKAT